jgi:molybdopterin synthase sulfur carrier subunit
MNYKHKKMTVQLLSFGIIKEILGRESISFNLPKQSNTADLRNKLNTEFPQLRELASYMIAVNNEYADKNLIIQQKDEIALIPPVSGG